MNKKYQVFISSTYEDLKDERNAVTESLLDMGCCFPAGMERFPASSLSQWEYIKRIIDESDYYLLIVAGKYGSIDNDEKISYTEKEYNYAENKNIPILTFVHENIDNLPAKFVDKRRTQINNFRKKVSAGRLVKFYSNADDLKAKVKDTLYSEITVTPRSGWVRADELGTVQATQVDSQNPIISRDEIAKAVNQALLDHKATDDEVREVLWGNNNQSTLELSKEAKKLLVEAAKDAYGQILVSVTLDGTHIFTNGKQMNEEGNGKCVAIWEDAIMELMSKKLIKESNLNKDVYTLTREGYEVAEKISPLT